MTEELYWFRFAYMFKNGTGTIDIQINKTKFTYEDLERTKEYIKDSCKDNENIDLESLHIMSWSRIY